VRHSQSESDRAQDVPDFPAAEARALAFVGVIETVSGLCITGFFIVVVLGLLPALVLADEWVTRHPHFALWSRIELSVGWSLTMVIAIVSFNHLQHAVGRASPPVLLSTARQWLRVPTLIRPLVSAWWLMLALASPLTAHGIMAQIDFFSPNSGEILFQKSMVVILLFTASAAANTNFLIAVAALTGSEAILKFAWRIRLVFDIAAAVAVYFVRIPADSLNSYAGG
jgi:hypothetical protein